MGILNQTLTVAQISLQSVSKRYWSSINAMLGTAGVVGVVAAILSIATGYQDAMRLNGESNNLLIMSAGANSELESHLNRDQVREIKSKNVVALSDEGEPLIASEAYTIISLDHNGESSNIAVRGVESNSFRLRNSLELVAGRLPQPGMRELLIGDKLAARFDSLNAGRDIYIAAAKWQVVGRFTTGGSLAESEVWAELDSLQSALDQTGQVQLMYGRVRDDLSVGDAQKILNDSSDLSVSVRSEAEYYREQADQMGSLVKTIAYSIGFVMGLAATFAALNASYASVASRRKELATIFSIGADNRAIVLAIVFESAFLALVGGCLGSFIAYLLYDGHVASTLFSSRSFSHVVFEFSISPAVILQGVLIALFIGILGGLWPALKAVDASPAPNLTRRS